MKTKDRLFTRDQVRGCILGGAVGDALGYPVEFMSRGEILKRYGPDGITRHELNAEGLAEISDDTQMTLFTATGMLFAATRSATKGIGGNPHSYMWMHYLDWYATQTGGCQGGFGGSWLGWEPRMYVRRAPGNTCMSALEDIKKNGKDRTPNNSKGCGGVMRVAPVAVTNDFCNTPEALMVTLGAKIADITHNHPLGTLPAAAFVMILRRIATEGGYRNINYFSGLVQRVADDLENIHVDFDEDSPTYGEMYPEYTQPFKELLDKAVRLAFADVPDHEAVSMLGQGWTADEALAIALYCAMKHIDSFEDAVVAAVNHDGDSDSTGSICGNIMGLLVGESGIPQYYLQNLEIKDLMDEICEDIYQGCRIAEYSNYDDISPKEARDWEKKYIQCISLHLKPTWDAAAWKRSYDESSKGIVEVNS